ncbi:MAG: ABC transporter permease [Promethearchaeota archaeon]
MLSVERKENFSYLYITVKPIITTYIFELKKQWKKFVVFTIISVAFVFLLSYLPYLLVADLPLPKTQAEYLQSGIQFLSLIIIFGSCFFFSGIICTEFGEKTGYISFPIINKYKLIIGKYLGSLTLITGVISAFYIALGMIGMYYYGAPINYRYYYSFGIAMLYVLAVSGFVIFFSSFMKTTNMTIVSTLMLLLIANMIIDNLIILLYPDFEPIYSLNHASKLVSYILEKDFPTTREDRYTKEVFRGFAGIQWLTPTIEMGITIFLAYTIIWFVLASIIFIRRQL